MRQLLLPLLNATILLAIVLVALMLWLSYKVDDVSTDLFAQVDMRVIEAAEADIRDAAAEIHGLRDDLGAINVQLAQLIDKPETTLSPELREELDAINAYATRIEKAVNRLMQVDRQLSDRQIREIGGALAEVVIDIRDCRTGDLGA